MEKRQVEIKHYEHIENLASALKKCGYGVEICWDAQWYCSDNKTHCGIELTIDVVDGEGNPYTLIFNRKGQKITFCTEGERS